MMAVVLQHNQRGGNRSRMEREICEQSPAGTEVEGVVRGEASLSARRLTITAGRGRKAGRLPGGWMRAIPSSLIHLRLIVTVTVHVSLLFRFGRLGLFFFAHPDIYCLSYPSDRQLVLGDKFDSQECRKISEFQTGDREQAENNCQSFP